MNAVEALDQRLLRSFVVVAEELHFGRAARRLHISQPPLSMQIKKLEELVGVELFERDRRHVALTDAGTYLLPEARRWLREAEHAVLGAQRIAAGQQGVLRVGYTPTATYELLPAWLREMKKRSPELRLELHELRSGLQPAALSSGRIDLGFACGPAVGESDSGVEEVVLQRERMVAALPSRHPLASRRRIAITSLDGEDAVFVRPEVEPAWANAAGSALARAGVTLELVQETDTKLALLGLIAAGLGVSLVSRSMSRLARRGVVYRELSGFSLRVPLTLLKASNPSPRALQGQDVAQRIAREHN